jgi:hypothetical protein
MFRKLDLFPSLGEGRETSILLGPLERANLNHWTLRLALSKGPNRVGVSLTSPAERKRSSFRNIVFSSYLEYRTMDKVYEHSDSEWTVLLTIFIP